MIGARSRLTSHLPPIAGSWLRVASSLLTIKTTPPDPPFDLLAERRLLASKMIHNAKDSCIYCHTEEIAVACSGAAGVESSRDESVSPGFPFSRSA